MENHSSAKARAVQADRLAQAIEAVASIAAPSGTLNADEISLVLDRMKSHAGEIEAVSITLRMRGVPESEFHSVAPTLTPDDVAPTFMLLKAMDKSKP